MDAAPVDFARRLTDWQTAHGRHDLPWQREPTAYRVWVEIMLQQTQVSAVLPYFERFIARFPDVGALAAAPVDEVLHLWSGLGYYSRARNLHAAARRMVEVHQGDFPDTLAEAVALPGVGRSTAGAVLALARDQSHPILDGNAKRVLCRHRGIEGWPGNGPITRRLWALAQALTPASGAASYTQAIVDLGATVCVRSRPRCLLCPVAQDCCARLEGSIERIPAPRPRRERPLRRTRFALVRDAEGRVLLERRPPAGVWGGLWSFPELGTDEPAGAWCQRTLGVVPAATQALPELRHGFTHFELVMEPLLMTLGAAPTGVAEGDAQVWFDPKAPARIGLAAPVSRLLASLPAAL